MLDYQAIAALAAVIETQSFQKAAEKLFITQSAVSQRIKNLENHYGEPVLVRNQPYRPTPLGIILLGHLKRVIHLENVLQSDLASEAISQKISIAISRDGLETWFKVVLNQLKTIMPLTIEIIADDQEVTLSYLQKGIVSACASTIAKPLMGCQTELLGYFDYVLVASPKFIARYFKDKKNIKKDLLSAPAVIFDNKDELHKRYLKHYFNLADDIIQYHIIPSVAGFRQFALNGYAYALIPEIDVINDLKTKKLVNLFPDKVWEMPVYWHRWSVETKSYKAFNDLVQNVANKILRQTRR